MKEQDRKEEGRGLIRGCHRVGRKIIMEHDRRKQEKKHRQRERKGVKKTHYGTNYRDGGNRGLNRKSQAESIICETEMDRGPLQCLIPLFYVKRSSHRANTCTDSVQFGFSLWWKKTS